MAVAVNRLAEGLSRTQKFSQEVGGGDFDTPYEPLSDDDALGKALLQMRSSLAENERELEGKVEERTEELAQQKARAEEILGDLQDSISYALHIQQAILPSEQERREVVRPGGLLPAQRRGLRRLLLVQVRAAVACLRPSTARVMGCQGRS